MGGGCRGGRGGRLQLDAGDFELGPGEAVEQGVADGGHPVAHAAAAAHEGVLVAWVLGEIAQLAGVELGVVELVDVGGVVDVIPAAVAEHALGVEAELTSEILGEDVGAAGGGGSTGDGKEVDAAAAGEGGGNGACGEIDEGGGEVDFVGDEVVADAAFGEDAGPSQD